MQLKTYSASSMTAVLSQIKQELGPDAVILESAEENGQFKVTAALERKNSVTQRTGNSPGNGTGAGRPGSSSGAGLWPGSGTADPLSGWQGGSWQEEWGSIKHHLLQLMKPTLKLGALPPRQRLALEFLQNQGVCDEAVFALYQKMTENPEGAILDILGEIVRTKPFGADEWPQQIQILAGPSGSGKTTLAVRLALMLRKSDPGMRICLVNADASRGNGRLLLKHYAELSDFAYRESTSPIELAAAIVSAQNERYDRIIIDLPAMSGKNYLAGYLADSGLGKTENAGCARKAAEKKASAGYGVHTGEASVHLALPLHYSHKTMCSMLSRYRCDIPCGIIWTKLDEAESFGEFVSAAFKSGLPVSALSYGPGLGASLSPAGETAIWRMLFKQERPDANKDKKTAQAACGAQ